MKKLILLISSVIWLSIGHSLFGQVLNSKQIDSLVEKAMDISPSIGIAIAVVKDGKVIHSKGYGVKSIKNKKPHYLIKKMINSIEEKIICLNFQKYL